MTTFPIHKIDNHLAIKIGDRTALIDTGSPMSIADAPFEFLGVRQTPSKSIPAMPGRSISVRDLSELAGFRIDILIGTDLLQGSTLRIRWREGFIDVGDDIPDYADYAPLHTPMGVPVIPLAIDGRSRSIIFDTGAHLSYIDPNLVEGRPPLGTREDFHPMMGRFTATTYKVPVALDATPLGLECGVLPDTMGAMLRMTLAALGASAVVGTQLLEHFDLTLSWPRERASWQRAGGK